MLTETQIAEIQSGILNIYGEIEFEIMRNIGKRLKITDNLGGSDEWRMLKISENKELKKQNLKIIAKYSERTEKEVKKLFSDAAIISVEDDETEYLKGVDADVLKPQPPIKDSKAIQKTVKRAVKDANEFLNLTNTKAVESASEEFLKVVNTAFIQVDEGLYSFDTAIRRASLKLADQGITAQTYRYKDAEGKIRTIKYNIDAALRREIHTASLNTARKAQDDRMDEYDVDTYEVSSHMGARPRCAIDQGKIFSRSGKKPYGRPETEGEAAGLFGINCSHQKYPFIPDVSTQRFFPVDDEENEKAYIQSQQQRYLENEVKKEKRRLILADHEEDMAQFERSSVKLKQKEANLKGFMDKTGRQQTPRVSVTGFTRSTSQKAVQANKRATKGAFAPEPVLKYNGHKILHEGPVKKWTVLKKDDIIQSFDTKAEAMEYGRNKRKRGESDVFVFKKDSLGVVR